MQNLYAIPAELRALRQFVLWKYVDVGAAKQTKVPYQINGEKADVTNPFTWARFEEVFNVLGLGGYDGIGFVFTANDPYAFIDLDYTDNSEHHQRQIKIYHEFDSYSELSPSGKGLHIIVKGQVPQGRRRDSVEVYSSARYATMTGHVYNDKPIFERQQLLDQLFAQMGGPPTIQMHTGNEPQTQSDQEIYNMALNAINGDKFLSLWNGDVSLYNNDHSAADQALFDILSFYTQNREQIIRMFRSSLLGKRSKAYRGDYIERTLSLSFDRTPPKVDFDGFRIALEEKIAQNTQNSIMADSVNGKPAPFEGVTVGSSPASAAEASPSGSRPAAHNGLIAGSNPAASTIPLPPGLLGEIAQFIYESAPRPVIEIAISGAIGLMAGICGNSYNVSATGLNQYILCLAGTGVGKDAAASGIDKIISEVSKMVPVANEFIGPSEIASGQALLKHISNKPNCFVSVLGEFGIKLKMMSDPKASAADQTLRRTLLQLYTKSGLGQTVRASIYADKDKNTIDTISPSISILAESTPETVYEAVNEQMVIDGLLPRFTIIEYNGQRKLLNKNHAHNSPSPDMINRVAELMAHCKMMMANKKVIQVVVNDNVARILDNYDKFTTEKINAKDVNRAIKELWSRADVKILKLSALLAVGINPYNPIIDESCFDWAKRIIETNIVSLSKKFETGETGKASNELRQIYDLKKIMKQYVMSPHDRYKKLDYIKKDMHAGKVILYKFLSQRTGSLASYKDEMGRGRATEYLNKVLKVMIDNGEIVEVSKLDMLKRFNSSQKAYVISDMSILDEVNIGE